MPKAILHVGTMKTGTTSIQTMLSQNAASLAKHGYAYLGPPMRHSSSLNDALSQLQNPNSDLIISDEGLWHFAHTKRSDTKYLARLLRPYQVNVLIYLRRPDSFLSSWFQQGLKSGTGAQTMSQFLNSPFVLSGLDFQNRIGDFERLFGPESIKLRPYEKNQLVEGDAVRDFLYTVGLRASDFTLPERSNETPNTDSLLLRSLLQRNLPRTAELRQLLSTIDKHLAANGYKGRRYNLLTQSELDELVVKYRPVFTELQSKYGGGSRPDFFESWPEHTDEGLLDLRKAQERLLAKED